MTLRNLVLASLFSITALIYSSSASADFLIEPHIGYNLSTSGDGDAYTGKQIGARVGYQTFGLMLGLDYTKSSLDFKDSNDSGDRTDIAAFVGYNLPILARAWVSQTLSSKYESSALSSKAKGSVTELGFGFTALPFVSLNVMYRMVKVSENTISGVTTDADEKANEIVVGVSLPLTL